jgi:3-oxoacyl-(acyl-carrier-protein) synthase
VVVTGQGVVSSLGNSPDEFYNNLLAGKSGIGLIEGWDTCECVARLLACLPCLPGLHFCPRVAPCCA